MKRLLVTAVLCFTAYTPTTQASTLCNITKAYAYSAMTSRQTDVSAQDAIQAVRDTDYDARTEDIMMSILYGAYSHPVYPNVKDKQNIVRRFSMDMYKECNSLPDRRSVKG